MCINPQGNSSHCSNSYHSWGKRLARVTLDQFLCVFITWMTDWPRIKFIGLNGITFVRFINVNGSAAWRYWSVLSIMDARWLVHCSATQSSGMVRIQDGAPTLNADILHFNAAKRQILHEHSQRLWQRFFPCFFAGYYIQMGYRMNTPLSPQSGLEGQQKKIAGTFGRYLTRQEAARWAKLCLVWTQGYQNLNSQ